MYSMPKSSPPFCCQAPDESCGPETSRALPCSLEHEQDRSGETAPLRSGSPARRAASGAGGRSADGHSPGTPSAEPAPCGSDPRGRHGPLKRRASRDRDGAAPAKRPRAAAPVVAGHWVCVDCREMIFPRAVWGHLRDAFVHGDEQPADPVREALLSLGLAATWRLLLTEPLGATVGLSAAHKSRAAPDPCRTQTIRKVCDPEDGEPIGAGPRQHRAPGAAPQAGAERDQSAAHADPQPPPAGSLPGADAPLASAPVRAAQKADAGNATGGARAIPDADRHRSGQASKSHTLAAAAEAGHRQTGQGSHSRHGAVEAGAKSPKGEVRAGQPPRPQGHTQLQPQPQPQVQPQPPPPQPRPPIHPEPQPPSEPQHTSGTPAPNAKEWITLILRNEEKGETSVNIRAHTKFDRLMRGYCRQKALDPDAMVFVLDGRALDGLKSAQFYDLYNEDIVEVYRKEQWSEARHPKLNKVGVEEIDVDDMTED